jgi:hypothetical protein
VKIWHTKVPRRALLPFALEVSGLETVLLQKLFSLKPLIDAFTIEEHLLDFTKVNLVLHDLQSTGTVPGMVDLGLCLGSLELPGGFSLLVCWFLESS